MAIRNSDEAIAVVGVGAVGVGAVLWAAGAVSAFVCGHAVPRGHPLAGVLAFAQLGDPSAAWDSPVGPAPVFWLVTAVMIAAAAAVAVMVYRVFAAVGADQSGHGGRSDGLATRPQVRRAAGVRVLTRRPRCCGQG